MEVASPQGWYKNPELVLNFYNLRRNALKTVVPNEAHYILAELEEFFDVHIITQNVDDLHERAGSTNILHLHGELLKSRSTIDLDLVYDCIDDIKMGDLCEKGSQIRPNIVWFGEAVPLFEDAISIAETADILLIIGTSLVVYPAAGLTEYVPKNIPIYVIDPNNPPINFRNNVHYFTEKATSGTQKIKKILMEQYG
jgi:NAD-dependent deacetylase